MKHLLNSTHTVWVIALITPLIYFTQQLMAQTTQPLEWHTFWGAASGQPEDKGQAIAYYDGYIYIAGFSCGAWDVDPEIIVRDHISSFQEYNTGRDGYVAKMTPEGNLEWLTYLGSPWDDDCQGIEVTTSGIYVCGYSNGVWLDEGALGSVVKRGHFTGNGPDGFAARLNFDGSINWISFLGGIPADFATDIEVDESSGFLYVTGYSSGEWISDTYQNSPINPHSAGEQYDAFAVKLETDGDYLWHTFMGGINGNGGWDWGSGVDFDGSGNVYIGGTSAGTWGTPLTGFEHQGGGEDGFIAKLNPSGVYQWHMFMGNTDLPEFADRCHDIQVDIAGNIYATGYSWGDWAPVWETPVVEYGDNQQEDIFVTKINTNGAPQWYTILGEGGGNQGHDIELMANGDIYISGYDGDCWGNPTLTKPAGNSGADAFAMKLDNDGNLLWRAMMGGTVTDNATGIVVDESETVFITGYSFLNWWCVEDPLHTHTGNPTPENYGDYHTDIFVARLNQYNSVIVPEHVHISVTEGEIAETVVALHDLCDKLLSVIVDRGVLDNNGDDTYDWSYNTVGVTPGNYEVTISGNDGNCWTPSAIIDLDILPANQPPFFTIDYNPVYVQKGETATNSGTVSDPEDNLLSVGSWPLQLHYDGSGNWSWSMETSELPLGVHPVTLSAWDGEIEALDVFEVIVKDDEERIGSGLEWLAGQQDDGGGDEDGSWNGQFDCWVQNDAPVTITGFALAKYCANAYENGFSPFDPSYNFHGQIVEGFNYLFSRAQSDGEGLGIYFNDPYPFEFNYSTAAVMMAVGASRLPSYLINYPANPLVHGLTFMDLMNEMVTYIISTQESDGSWNGNNDVTGNVAFGLLYAEEFGIVIPQVVKDNLSSWIDLTQEDVSSGGVRSNPISEDPNMLYTAHIMVEMALVGDNVANPRVQNAINYLADHWCLPEGDDMWADKYVELLYTIMKAFKLYSIESIITCEGEIDWFADLINRIYSAGQNYEEGWWFCTWSVSTELATCLALLAMEGDIPMPPVDNQPPEITVDVAEVVVFEGTNASNTGTVSDMDGDALTLSASAGTVINNNDGTWSWDYPTNDGPSESQTIIINVEDENGASNQTSFTLTVHNMAPDISNIILPAEPVSIDEQPVIILVSFTDPAGISDAPFSCTIEFGDGESETITTSDFSFNSSTHSYTQAGVFNITVTIIDKDQGTAIKTTANYIVIYDPFEGFVTGGGWIESPESAYLPDPTLTGIANFGFVSKYKKGQSVPSGNTEFRFHAADLNFHSTIYHWMIITNHKAMYKGEGKINGDGNYGFQLSAIDADLTPSTDVDLFRIRIWDKNNNDALVYDNKVGETDPNADPTTELGGGNIKIHSDNKSKPAEGFNDDMIKEVPDECMLLQSYPNPANYTTTIRFGIPEDSHVLLRIFDITGNIVIILKDQDYKAGYHSVELNTSCLAEGIYFVRLEAGEKVANGKMMKKR